ncbi:hypothetical protein D3C72_2069490 [compost metagenome]
MTMACNSPSGTDFSASAKNQISAISSTPRRICSLGGRDRRAWRNGACRATRNSAKAAKPQ